MNKPKTGAQRIAVLSQALRDIQRNSHGYSNMCTLGIVNEYATKALNDAGDTPEERMAAMEKQRAARDRAEQRKPKKQPTTRAFKRVRITDLMSDDYEKPASVKRKLEREIADHHFSAADIAYRCGK